MIGLLECSCIDEKLAKIVFEAVCINYHVDYFLSFYLTFRDFEQT